ncbi:MAG: DMT family transporter [Chloroflexi bacterium]|nr:DMT family transporter [Chloroflexota bacterium]
MNLKLSGGYLYSLAAAICYGSSAVLIRQGMSSELAPPLVGATLSLFWGTLALLPQTVTTARTFSHVPRRAYLFFVLSGITSSIGMMSNFYALSLAPVVVVAPLTSINPLVTILWAHLFLKRLEKVTLRVVLGAALVVAGVIIITLGRALS